VHAVQTLKAMGVQAIMVNCNPETVSTDYLEADKLYIEPLDDDAVLDILRVEKPAGVLLQFGGQSPLKLASKIAELGVPILGSSLASIDLCENRDAFESCLRKLGVASPASQSYDSVTAAEQSKAHMSYPVLVRPSYVIGGQGMSVVHSATELTTALARIQDVSPSNPLIVQEFLGDGVEFDVDIVTDAKQAVVVGILRHLDPPGIHSGDSVCEWLPREEIERDSNLLSLMETCSRLALDVGAVGLINVQCVMREKKIFVLEANPRCSRTVPFLAKIQHRKEAFPDAQGIIGAATRICLGASITELVKEGWSWLQSTQSGFLAENVRNPEVVPSSIEYAFKFPVFPYGKFESLAVGPGPEMHSLGEVMGRDSDRVRAFYKGALAAGWKFPDLKQPGVLDIWFDCAESQQAMQLILSELAFAIKSTAWELRIVADISELGEAGFVLAPSYLDACAKKPTLRGQIAQAIGRGVPAALSPQSAGLAIHAFCKHAHDREAQH
jgi:carbamoyl-phosphate synthase large subunit